MAPRTAADGRPAVLDALLGAALLALAAVVVRSAWMCDDAYVTLRSVDHLTRGHGAVFNVGERVQAYTHPLWMLLLTAGHLVSDDAFETPILLSLGCTALSVGLAARAAGGPLAGAALALVLASAKGFVDFSTSGLENPLTHLIVAGFAGALVRDARLGVLAGLAGLGMVNRLDTALLFGPALAWSALRDPRPRRLAEGAWILVPLLAWHVPAFVYYGFPLPNTAYAKLGTGIPQPERWAQGLDWLRWARRRDPSALWTLAVAVPAAVAAWRLRGDRGATAALVAGAFLYVGYVVRIGGDFMGDRFLSAPLLLAALALARTVSWSDGPRAGPGLLAALALVAVSLGGRWSPWYAGPGYTRAPPFAHIVDERGYYFDGAGWFADGTVRPRPSHRFARGGRAAGAAGRRYVVKPTIGMHGYFAGPGLHLVDPLGLSDPLLARLPAAHDDNWRVGHFRRVVPEGYARWAGIRKGRIADEGVAAYVARLDEVTRGPLFSASRWSAIWALNTRPVDDWVDTARYRFPRRFGAPGED